MLSQAFTIRNKSDYDDFYIVSKQEAKDQLEKANEFMIEICGYINRVK